MHAFRDPILAAFGRLVERDPERLLVASPRRAWSSGDLDRASAALATRLTASGLDAGDALALSAAPGPAFLAGYLAIRRLGAVPVLCDAAPPTADRLAALDRLGVVATLAAEDGWCGAERWGLDVRPHAGRSRCDPAWGAIKLSSGSTGDPRGIAVTSEALAADEAQLASSMGVGADDRILVAVPMAHSYGFSSIVLPALVRGARLLVPEESGALAPLAPLEVARQLEATFFPTVPAYLRGLVRLASLELPPSLVRVIAAGAPLRPETAAAFRARTGRPVHVFYGASECGGITYDRAGDAAERGTVGAPVDGVDLSIESGSGRLRIRSAAVAERYLPDGSPELDGGSFLSGDRAAWADGEIRLVGRADDLVIVRGRNVQPHEVERVLASYPGVEEVAVLGVEGPEGPRTLLRAVIATGVAAFDRAAALAYCRERLAEHKVPRSLIVVRQLPRTARGKLDRAALAALADR